MSLLGIDPTTSQLNTRNCCQLAARKPRQAAIDVARVRAHVEVHVRVALVHHFFESARKARSWLLMLCLVVVATTDAGSLSPQALRDLIENGEGRDRAFADAIVRMAWLRTSEPQQRAELGLLHAAIKAASLREHRKLRALIAQGELRGPALRELFDGVAPLERDHFVEEVLGIAYGPLDEPELGTDQMTYAPSGYDEIVHAFDASGLAAADRFLDLGAGLGKVVMLAALLTGAKSRGVERDGVLCELAETARRELGLGDVQLRRGDAREADSSEADVIFMYLPFTGEVLATVMGRLLSCTARAGRRRFLCTGPLDPVRYPQLVPAGPPKSWLNVYAFAA
jgi:protein-L-isoaspartate O-methyltransferase